MGMVVVVVQMAGNTSLYSYQTENLTRQNSGRIIYMKHWYSRFWDERSRTSQLTGFRDW